MNYQRHYKQLNQRARDRLLEGYTERHHIVPRCMGGSDDSENIAILTAREHYIAHQLLIKMYPGNHQLAKAAYMMTINSNEERVNNRLYEWLKKRNAIANSELTKGIPKSDKHRENISKGKKNKLYGAYSEERKQNIANGMQGGPQKIVDCPVCKKTGGISLMKRYHFDNCKLTQHTE